MYSKTVASSFFELVMKKEPLMTSIFPIPRNTIIVIILSCSKENIQLSQHLTASIQISSPQILFIKICCLENRVEWKSILHDILTSFWSQICAHAALEIVFSRAIFFRQIIELLLRFSQFIISNIQIKFHYLKFYSSKSVALK